MTISLYVAGGNSQVISSPQEIALAGGGGGDSTPVVISHFITSNGNISQLLSLSFSVRAPREGK